MKSARGLRKEETKRELHHVANTPHNNCPLKSILPLRRGRLFDRRRRQGGCDVLNQCGFHIYLSIMRPAIDYARSCSLVTRDAALSTTNKGTTFRAADAPVATDD